MRILLIGLFIFKRFSVLKSDRDIGPQLGPGSADSVDDSSDGARPVSLGWY